MKQNNRIIMSSVPILAACFLVAIIFVQTLSVETVIVDGKRKGPSALKNQSDERELIDNFNTKQCGLSDEDTKSSRFVNSAREGQFPWLASLQAKNKKKWFHFCQASFISDQWLISAAHCFKSEKDIMKNYYKKKKLRISAGSTNAFGQKNSYLKISEIYYHSKFNPKSPIGFDVSLIKLEKKVKLRRRYKNKLPYINTVCLPKEGKDFEEGQAVKLAGWGDSEYKDTKSKPSNLLTTDLKIADSESCAKTFAEKDKKVKDNVKKQEHKYHDFICADYHGERDACQGDSGGSLLEYADGKAVAVGIVSYGLKCAEKGVPGVYSKTSAFLPWIKDIIENGHEATVDFEVKEIE